MFIDSTNRSRFPCHADEGGNASALVSISDKFLRTLRHFECSPWRAYREATTDKL